MRAVRLVSGCGLLGVGIALMVMADLGLSPWDVLHQGVSKHTGIPIGTVGIIVGLGVLAAWIPLKVRLRLGTAVNVVVVGLTVDGTLALSPDPHGAAARTACLLAGVVLCGLGTSLYIGAGMGTGPRDGLMTALAVRTRRSIRLVRTGIELSALGVGAVLGGSVGIGTVVFALAIGPLIQLFLGYLTVPVPTLTTPAE
jgi:uncharacterized membrane protein YczE